MSDHRSTIESSGSQPPSRDLLLGLLLGCVVGATIPTILMRGREPAAPAPAALAETPTARSAARANVDSITPPDSGPVGFAEFLPLPSPVERRLEQALEKTVTTDFTDTPLIDVVTFLADELSVNMVLDTEAMTDSGIATDTPVTRRLPNISANAALKLILQPLSLTVVIDSEVLRVTTAEKANEILIARTYPVSDLVRGPNDLQSLIRLLQEETAGPWKEIDGDGGTITEVEQTGSLVVRQSYAVQREVLSLIRRQREAQRRMIPVKPSLRNPRGQFPGAGMSGIPR